MVSFPDPLSLLVTVQLVGATSVFVWLSSYNARHKRRFEEAQRVLGKKNASFFELPAFRAADLDCQNPFENTTWSLTTYEHLKISLSAVTLFPPRLLGGLGTFVGTCVFAAIFLRIGLRWVARLVVAAGCRMLLFCFGFWRIKVSGKQSPGVGVLISNHCTFLDGVVWIAVCAPRIFAEESNFKQAMMQVFAQALGVVCFDRGGSESRRMAREKMASAAAEAVAGKAPPILVFPEGTTKNLKTVITFKDGAFAPGLPVQPAVLRYRYQHCDPTWVFAGPGLLMLCFRLFCQLQNNLEVEFLPVCEPDEQERAQPHLFARRVQVQVATAMGVPMTEHAVEDIQLEVAALKANLPAEVGVVGFSALKEFFAVDTRTIKQQMLVFREMDRRGTGRVSFEDFVDGFKRAFHAPSKAQTELLHQFFQQLTGGQPTLDFRKYLIGIALVNEAKVVAGAGESTTEPSTPTPTSVPDAEDFVDRYKGRMYAHLAFAAFAADSDSRISRREFEELWGWLHQSEESEQKEKDEERTPGAAFDKIAGAGAVELGFEAFLAHSERHPEFEKSLRQAFFSRISTVLTSS